MRILIVGDKEGSREGLASLLQDEGYGVEVAGNIIEAWEKLRETLFDLIITDLEMSDQMGIELVDLIKFTHPASSIVMLTAYETDQNFLQEDARGLSVFLEKPIDPSGFLRMLERLKKKRWSNRANKVVF